MVQAIPLTRGLVAIVDDEDFAPLSRYNWYAGGRPGKYYAHRHTTEAGRRIRISLHRAILSPPDDMVVDHINGDTLDNRRSNLRLCTVSENAINVGLTRSNKSGFKGVSWVASRGMWRAGLTSKGQSYYLGQFETADAAARAYDEAALRLHGEFARTNAMIRSPEQKPSVPDACGRYEPAARLETSALRFAELVEPDLIAGCWLWAGPVTPQGYGTANGVGRTERAHRLSYRRHCGEIPAGAEVSHRCGVRLCVNPAHLFVGTRQDICDERVAKGRQRKGAVPANQGERHYLAKLTETQVREIRASTGPLGEAAERYGISRSTVSLIRLRQTWRHLTEAA